MSLEGVLFGHCRLSSTVTDSPLQGHHISVGATEIARLHDFATDNERAVHWFSHSMAGRLHA